MGTRSCSACGGSGRQTGTRFVSRPETQYVFDPITKRSTPQTVYRSHSETTYTACGSCGGSGRVYAPDRKPVAPPVVPPPPRDKSKKQASSSTLSVAAVPKERSLLGNIFLIAVFGFAAFLVISLILTFTRGTQASPPSTPVPVTAHAKVITPVLNVRASADPKGELLGSLAENTEVDIFEEARSPDGGRWVHIKSHQNGSEEV